MSIHEATQRVADCMDQILTNFKAGVRITVLVRTPGKPKADFCLTDDDLDEVSAMVTRRKSEATPQKSETEFDASRDVSEDEIEQWAATRADDAGYLARKLITMRRREIDREMFIHPTSQMTEEGR